MLKNRQSKLAKLLAFEFCLSFLLIFQMAFLPIADTIPNALLSADIKVVDLVKGFKQFAAALIMPCAYADAVVLPENGVFGGSSATGLSKAFQADLFTGKAGFSYPLNVPAGRKGIQPNLALSYSTQGGNSWCGVGWNLDLGSISRSTKSGKPKYNSTDTFIFSMNGSESELVSIGGNEYRAKLEGAFMKISFDGTFWVVTDKSGMQFRFGFNGDSRLTNASGTHKWYLDRVTDKLGNYMAVIYAQDQGTAYLSQIKYTGNDLTSDPTHYTIDFIREVRTDVSSNFRTGHEVKVAYRLKEVQAKVDSQLACKYVLNYSYSIRTLRSVISSITAYGADGITALPAMTFTYNVADFNPGPSKAWASGLSGTTPLMGDFNGDGLTDIILNNSSSVGISDGNNLTFSNWPRDNGDPNFTSVADFNGDGRSDLCVAIPTVEIWGLFPSNNRFVESGLYAMWGTAPGAPLNTICGDFNGDGMTDVYIYFSTMFFCRGTSFDAGISWEPPAGFTGKKFTGDFNGDGLTDIAVFDNGTISVAYSNGLGFIPGSVWITGFGNNDYTPFAMDVNGDGLADAVTFSSSTGTWKVAYSTGTSFVAQGVWINNFGTNKYPLAGDCNGNGTAGPGYFDNGTLYLADTVGNPNDLLIRVDNGLGGYNSFDYQQAPHTTDVPFTVTVLKSVTANDGMGNSYTTNYEFSGGMFDREDREFRGFNYAKVTSPEGSYSETYFKQDDIYKGRIYLQQTKDASGNLYAKQEKAYNYTTPYTGVMFVYSTQDDSYSYEGDTTFKHTAVQYTYDGYGNLTQTKALGDVDVAGDEKTEVTEYNNNTDLWLLGVPKRGYLLDASNNKLSEKRFYYDNATSIDTAPTVGLLTKEEAWLYNPVANTQSYISGSYAYDAYGNVTAKTNALGKTVTTQYDSTYHAYPVSVTNTLGQTITTTYDYRLGKILTTTDCNNQTTSSVYDALGRTLKVYGPLDSVDYPEVSYQYELSSLPLKVIKESRINRNTAGVLATFSFYDGLGRLIQVKSPAQNDTNGTPRQIVSQTVKLDVGGKVKEKYFPYFVPGSNSYVTPTFAQAKVVFDYDAMGRVVKTTNPDGTYATTSYGDWVVTSTDENGHYTTSYNDAYGRAIKVEEHNNGATYTTTYEYDPQGNLIKLTDNQGNISRMWYDSLGRKIKMDDPDMGIWLYSYDALGNLISQTDAKNQTITFTYDDINRLIQKSSGSTVLAAYHYDDSSKDYCVGRLSYVQDQTGMTHFYYNQLGQEIKSTKTITGSGAFTVERTYDALNRLTTLKYPDNETVTYTYDEGGALKRVVGNSTYVSAITYSPTGQIARIEYGNGTSTNYSYNPQTLRLSNLVTQNNAGQLQNLTYNFDNVGNVTGITDTVNNASQTFTYDDLDRLKQATGCYGVRNYSYDSIGNMLTKDGYNLTYGKNAKLPHAVTNYNGMNIDYDLNGNMVSKGNKSYSYDVENRLTQVNGPDAGVVKNYTFHLNQGWNFISLPVQPISTNIADVLFSIAGKYSQVSRYNGATNKFEHYVGNSKYNQFDSMEYGKGYQVYVTASAGADLALSGSIVDTATLALSAAWNLIGASSTSRLVNSVLSGVTFTGLLSYDSSASLLRAYPSYFSQLEAGKAYYLKTNSAQNWTLQDSFTTQFSYDGDGARVKKSVIASNGEAVSTTVYVGSLYEIDNGSVKKHIFAGSNKVCTRETAHTYFTHGDHLGSSNIVTDENGAKVSYYEYDPFGTTARQTGTDVTRYKFTGKELDNTGLYYYSARYYDPQLGRFISADTVVQSPFDPQSLNRYSYCRNNPVKYTDPTGHFWGLIVAAIKAIWGFVAAHTVITCAVIGAAAGGISAYQNGGNIFVGIVAGGILGAMSGGTLASSSASLLAKWGAGLCLASQVTSAMPGETWAGVSEVLGYAGMAASAVSTIQKISESFDAIAKVNRLSAVVNNAIEATKKMEQTAATRSNLATLEFMKELTSKLRGALMVKPMAAIAGGIIGGAAGGALSDWKAEGILRGANLGITCGYATSGTKFGLMNGPENVNIDFQADFNFIPLGIKNASGGISIDWGAYDTKFFGNTISSGVIKASWIYGDGFDVKVVPLQNKDAFAWNSKTI